jgi:flagellar basal body rod protein FlgC
MIDFSTPLAGMSAAEQSINKIAANVATAGSSTSGDSVDLSAEAVALLQAKNDFHANANVVHAEDDVYRSLLKMVG